MCQKKVFAYVKVSKSGKEFDLEGKYFKEVNGVQGNAVLIASLQIILFKKTILSGLKMVLINIYENLMKDSFFPFY